MKKWTAAVYFGWDYILPQYHGGEGCFWCCMLGVQLFFYKRRQLTREESLELFNDLGEASKKTHDKSLAQLMRKED